MAMTRRQQKIHPRRTVLAREAKDLRKLRESREIREIEQEPDPRWFVEHVTAQGERKLYLRIEITGLHPRRIGPLSCAGDGLVLLACFLARLEDALGFLERLSHDDDGPFKELCVLEDELASTYRR